MSLFFCYKMFNTRYLHIVFNINNKNSFECSPIIIACILLAYIFGVDSKVRVDRWLRMGLLPPREFADISYPVEN